MEEVKSWHDVLLPEPYDLRNLKFDMPRTVSSPRYMASHRDIFSKEFHVIGWKVT